MWKHFYIQAILALEIFAIELLSFRGRVGKIIPGCFSYDCKEARWVIECKPQYRKNSNRVIRSAKNFFFYGGFQSVLNATVIQFKEWHFEYKL